MNSKLIARFSIFVALALLATLIPFRVRAGGVCGGAYVVEKGDTVAKLAALCGTSAELILAVNPNLKEPLAVGQTITIPGANFNSTATSGAGNATAVNASPTSAVGHATAIIGSFTPTAALIAYVIQEGDSFASIAARYNVSIADLRAANPNIADIDYIFVGQKLFIPVAPNPSTPTPTPVLTQTTPHPLFYNSELPKNAAFTDVELINKSGSQVYISFRTTTAGGAHAINEFPVKGRMKVSVPAGWIDYVAWVGGVKYTGGFVLRDGVPFSVTFLRGKVVAE